MSWSEYAQAARELAELRRADAATEADRASLSETAEGDLDKLGKHLVAQKANLTDLAKTLRLPAPWFGRAERSPVTDLAVALHHSADAANAADVAARAAEDAATRPLLLPDFSPVARNALLYLIAAIIGWLLQCGLLSFNSETEFSVIAWSLCGLPAIAFFLGFGLVATVGQPRIGSGYPKNVQLGGAICFVGMPVAWIVLVALMQFIRP